MQAPCNYKFQGADSECGRDAVWRIDRKNESVHSCSWHVRYMCLHDGSGVFIVGVADYNRGFVLCKDERGDFYLYRL